MAPGKPMPAQRPAPEVLAQQGEQHCPTKAEVATPIDYADIPDKAKGCPGMAPQNQTQANAA